MAASAFDRLLRVLDLEERQGWRNRAVIGGLAAMAERWEKDARQEASELTRVRYVVTMMARYQTAAAEDRVDLAAMMRAALRGDAVDWDETEAGEPPSPPAAKPLSGKPPKPELGKPEALKVGKPLDEDDWARAVYAATEEGWSPPPPPEPTQVAQERSRRQQAAHRRSADDLNAPVTQLSGVGSAVAEQLDRLGIAQIRDLLWHLPSRHDDFSRQRTIAQLQPGEQVTVVANLWELRERKLSVNRQMIQGILADGTGTLHATWWNKHVRKQLKLGSTLRFSGKVGLYMGHKTLENPVFEDVDEEMVATGRLTPVYPLTEGLGNKKLRGLIKLVLDDYGELVADPLPAAVAQAHDLPGLPDALRYVHFPADQAELAAGLRRLAFDELLLVQLGALQRRRELRAADAPALVSDDALWERFRNGLPFPLTGAQQRVLGELALDLARPVPMTRMVQGDVGSGKTAIAAAGMVVAAANGAQAALLAPTQILAEQHFRSLSRLLDGQTKPQPDGDPVPLRCALLTGRVTAAARDQVLAGLADGTVDIVVGTTALIQGTVEFANLGLVVVDEQHRFGVEQRGALRNKGRQPHLLVMSATPIPRSLAMTIYGDLDLSVIDEMPPGREPVKTKWFRPRERERVYAFMRSEARQGRQAFIVYPLVEESDKLDAGAATESHARLQSEVFPDLRVALLHGRMSGQEKDEVMAAFAGGAYDILVSTTVIEVGIDVPNASVILIEDAERFGLAQLHQLRGRVGRGQHKSYCALVSKADKAEAAERLHALEATHSGFELAEKDLELRGPGEFLGTRQSGLPDLRVAQLGDLPTLLAAREAAQQLFTTDSTLLSYPELARQVARFWRGHGDVS